MTTTQPQYDEIADEYRQAKRLAVFDVFEHALFAHLPDLAGRSALDLACGEGFNTRRLKSAGAGRVVGMDISGEMIRLAREEEARRPLGIEYACRGAADLGDTERFDLVTAVFLLNYAESRAELLAMCQAIHGALEPGARFVAVADNAARGVLYEPSLRKYGFSMKGDAPMVDADPFTVELQAGEGQTITINNRYYAQTTYEWALVAAGFRDIRWHPLSVPPALTDDPEPGFWDELIARTPIAILEARR